MELKDYSGPYQPGFKIEDLSKESLVRLVQRYWRLFQEVDGFWYLSVMKNVSDEQALVCDLWVWEREAKREVRGLAQALNIQGDDVATLMKIYQVEPYLGNMEYEIELVNENHSVLTVTKCRLLEALEKEGGMRINTICGKVDPIIFRHYAEAINPDMQVQALKLPPRRNQDDICCQWEYKLERK